MAPPRSSADDSDDEDFVAPPSGEFGPPPEEAGPASAPEAPARPRNRSRGESRTHDEPTERAEDNLDATHAGPPVTVEIIEGPDRGRRKRFSGVRLVVGRGAGCDLELSDQSVSRRHVEMVYGEKGVML